MAAPHRDSLSSSGSKPERLGETSRQPPTVQWQGSRCWLHRTWVEEERFGHRFGIFWRSESLAHRPGEVALHTPTARPCCELDAVGKQRGPGTQA